MSDDLLKYVLFGSYLAAGLILLVGAMFSKRRHRRLSDWVMIVGAAISFFGTVAQTVLIFFEPNDFAPGQPNYELWIAASIAALFGTSGGLIVFGGGFLLSRFEAQRRLIHDEACAQGHPGSEESGGPQN